MALPTASDNAFPSLLITEGTAPASPAAGKRRLYVLSSDHLAYLKDSSGTVVALSGMTNPMTTKGDVILGDTSGVPSRLAAGTSTYVLTSNGAGAFPSWQAAAGGGAGALTLLEQHTASASASLDFTSFISGTYDNYVIEVTNILPATNSQQLSVLFSTNGGSTYISSGYQYAHTLVYGNGAGTAATAAEGHNSDASIGVGGGSVSNSGSGICGTLRLYGPGASGTTSKSILMHTTRQHTSVGIVDDAGYGALSVTAINAIQFKFASGNITSGVIRIYGIAKT